MFSSKLVFPCLVRNLYNNEDEEEEEEDEDDSDSLSQADSHVWIFNKQFVQKYFFFVLAKITLETKTVICPIKILGIEFGFK